MIKVLYQDNHVIAVNKNSGELTQPDASDEPALEQKVAHYLKIEGNKPGDAFVGVVHRIDKPVSGVVLMAKTSKALVRLNEQLKNKEFKKLYWAIVEQKPKAKLATLVHHIDRSKHTSKSVAHDRPTKESKEAVLKYTQIGEYDKYALLEVELVTGRHHQIRAQLSAIGCPIVGDVKYGAKSIGKAYGIALHSRQLTFMHPVQKVVVNVVAPVPQNDGPWKLFNHQTK